ncbi:MAG: peroxidase [Acidobacteria bacterium]|nr:peroxidase [Acidobacteriota bacterium]
MGSHDVAEPERLLFDFVDRVNRVPASIDAYDVEVLKAVGWSEEAVYDALTVCALFNYYNRWVDASGVADMGEDGYRAAGKRIAQNGYAKG